MVMPVSFETNSKVIVNAPAIVVVTAVFFGLGEGRVGLSSQPRIRKCWVADFGVGFLT